MSDATPKTVPFRGLRYSSEAGRLADLLAPPYDVIAASEQEALRDKSENNIVRLEKPAIVEGVDRYQEAAKTLAAWRDGSVLSLDESPAIYFYEQTFALDDQPRVRRGFFARVRIGESGERSIRPHEGTLPGPLRDRIGMLQSLRAQVSPIFGMYRSRSGLETPDRPALVDAKDGTDRHRIWALTSDDEIASVLSTMSGPIYIADGHHRYATAQAYRDECRNQKSDWTGDEPEAYTMMVLVPGEELVVLATHRMVKGEFNFDEVREKLERYFEMETVPISELMSRVESEGRRGAAFGAIGLESDGSHLLRLREGAAIDELLPADRSQAWKGLDVAILREVVLSACLGLDDDATLREAITYTPDHRIAAEAVTSGRANVAFLLNPTPVERVFEVADDGDTMPQKSTYFFPKLPTGLVLNSFD